MDSFGRRLKKLRTDRNLTQKQLASMLKISPSAVGMYERDEREPSFETTQQIADMFSTTTDYLLCRTDQPNKKISSIDDLDETDINNPNVKIWHKEFSESSEEAQREAIRYLRYLKQQEKGRKPGDKQK